MIACWRAICQGFLGSVRVSGTPERGTLPLMDWRPPYPPDPVVTHFGSLELGACACSILHIRWRYQVVFFSFIPKCQHEPETPAKEQVDASHF